MKLSVLVLSALVFSSQLFANPDFCYEKVEKGLIESSAALSHWQYHPSSLSSVPNTIAKNMINDSNAQEDDIDKSIHLLSDPRYKAYTYEWSAPSNSGISLAIVNADDCTFAFGLVLTSEE